MFNGLHLNYIMEIYLVSLVLYLHPYTQYEVNIDFRAKKLSFLSTYVKKMKVQETRLFAFYALCLLASNVIILITEK